MSPNGTVERGRKPFLRSDPGRTGAAGEPYTKLPATQKSLLENRAFVAACRCAGADAVVLAPQIDAPCMTAMSWPSVITDDRPRMTAYVALRARATASLIAAMPPRIRSSFVA